MAAKTSTAAGVWNVGGTWVGGVAPVAGGVDTTTLNHAVEVSATTNIGTSPNTGGTAAIAINNGSLTLDSGVTMEARGDVVGANSDNNLFLSAGSTLSIKPPSGQQYKMVGAAASGGILVIYPSGSSGSRVTIKTDKSAGGLSTIMPDVNGNSFFGLATADYFDVIDMGTTSSFGMWTNIQNFGPSINHGTFTRSNYFLRADIGAGDPDILFKNTIFSDSVAISQGGGDVCCAIEIGGAGTSGIQAVDHNGWDLQIDLGTYRSRMTFNNNVLPYAIMGGSSSWSTGKFHDNIFYNNVGDANYSLLLYGPVTDCHFMKTSASNPHFLNSSGKSYTGCVLEAPDGNDGAGDGINAGDGSFTIQNCLVNHFNNTAAAKLAGLGVGMTSGACTILHNTMFGINEDGGLCQTNETSDSYAGQIAACRSNLVLSEVANGSSVITASGGAGVIAVDAVTIATHNASWNEKTGTCLHNTSTSQNGVKRYRGIKVSTAGAFPNAQVGANDVDLTGNPCFDSDRNWTAWGEAIAGLSSPTSDDVFEWAKNHPTEATDSTTGSVAWEKDGFRVTGSQGLLLKDAGHDSVTIGAMEFVETSAGLGITDLFGDIFDAMGGHPLEQVGG